MKNIQALDIRLYEETQICKALCAYHKKYRMVLGINCTSLLEANVRVCLHHYPFTRETMPYASINLINLAIEQSLIVMFDRLVLQNAVKGPWNGIDQYRSLVSAGCWLVPKLTTKVVSPIPLGKDIYLHSIIKRIRSSKKRVVLSFFTNNPNYLSSNGLAVFEKNKVFLRSVS